MAEVQFIKITSIKLPDDRFRRTFSEKNLSALQDSISTGPGLINAITIKPNLELNTGETRLKAVSILHDLGLPVRYHGDTVPDGHIPAVIISNEMDEIEYLKAELHENTCREGFTFIEETQAVARIALLQQAIIDAAKPSKQERMAEAKKNIFAGIPLAKVSGEAVTKTAAQIFDGKTGGYYTQTVKDSLLIANAVAEQGPLAKKLEKATSLTDAQKILKKHAEEDTRRVLAVQQGKTFSSQVHTLLHGDCLVELAKLPERTFDVCCTDPIYGINAGNFGDSGGRMAGFDHSYDDSPENFKRIMPLALKQVTRVMKDAAHLYLACDLRHYFYLKELLETTCGERTNPWKVPNAPIIQYKLAGGRVPHPGFTFRRSYEVWLYAYRGGKQEYKLINDVIECTSDKTETHGAGKPVDLLKTLLSRSTMPGDKVLDFMAGSGSILPACHALKLRCTAIEIEDQYYGRMLERVKELR